VRLLLHGESLQAESCSFLARSMDSGATLALILALP
jgi:hypothetical protein